MSKYQFAVNMKAQAIAAWQEVDDIDWALVEEIGKVVKIEGMSTQAAAAILEAIANAAGFKTAIKQQLKAPVELAYDEAKTEAEAVVTEADAGVTL